MPNIIAIVVGVILTSFYIFPPHITGYPGVNTKLVMAVVALPLLLYRKSKTTGAGIDSNLVVLVLFGLAVSAACLLSVVINNTHDYTYVSYIFSALVWLAGAYTLVIYLRWIHSSPDVLVLTYYLAATCVAQCIIAILINRYPAFKDFFIQVRLLDPADIDYAENASRLYGIGCSYDPAGIRFAAVLTLMGGIFYNFIRLYWHKKFYVFSYLMAFFTITVIGNMLSRTTIFGFGIGIVLIIGNAFYFRFRGDYAIGKSIKWLSGFVMVAVIVVAFLYKSDTNFRKDFRYGFEGFVSLVETGEWNVRSNEILKTMYRWPDSLHTWIIGDGFIETTDNEEYYVGPRWRGYYQASDVGYVRFIYYGGVFFLIVFALFILKSAMMCAKYFPEYKITFYLLYVLQLIIWMKVATDIFCVYAIFLAIGMSRTQEEQQKFIEEYEAYSI